MPPLTSILQTFDRKKMEEERLARMKLKRPQEEVDSGAVEPKKMKLSGSVCSNDPYRCLFGWSRNRHHSELAGGLLGTLHLLFRLHTNSLVSSQPRTPEQSQPLKQSSTSVSATSDQIEDFFAPPRLPLPNRAGTLSNKNMQPMGVSNCPYRSGY